MKKERLSEKLMFRALCVLVFSAVPLFGLNATEINDHINGAAEVAKTDPVKAIELMNNAIAEHPKSGEVLIFRGMIYFDKMSDYERSQSDFYNGVLLLGDNPEKGKYLELIDELTTSFSSHEVFDFFNRSYSLIEIGDFPRAVELLNKSLSMQKNNARLYYELAYAYVELNDFENATKCIEASHKLNPVSMSILDEMKFVYIKTGSVDKLRVTIDSIGKIYGKDPSLHVDLAQGYLAAKDEPGMVAVLENAIREYPDYAYSYYTLGEYYFNSGKKREALPLLSKFIEKTSTDGIEDTKTRSDINKTLRKAKGMVQSAEDSTKSTQAEPSL